MNKKYFGLVYIFMLCFVFNFVNSKLNAKITNENNND